MTFRNKPIKNYQVSRPGPSSPDSSRFMGDHVLGIHDLGACRKGEGEKWISVCKNVSFCRCCLASNRSFLKLINFRESWKRGILSSETCERGCLLTSPSIFIHLPSARNPPRCSPSDEKGRDVSQPALLLQAASLLAPGEQVTSQHRDRMGRDRWDATGRNAWEGWRGR